MSRRETIRAEKTNPNRKGSKKRTRNIGKKLFGALIPPLLSLSLTSCPAARAEKAPKNPTPEIAKDKIVKDNSLEEAWSKGTCTFNEKEWSLTYESENEIKGKKEVKINLNKLEGVGSPEEIICGDAQSYIITQTHVLITLGGIRAFEDHVMLGAIGDELVVANIVGLDISPISKHGILLSLIVFDNECDKLYLFTRFGELWEVPLMPSANASCAFTAKYPPMGKVAMTTYKGLIVLIKEGEENIVLVESAKDKFITLPYESDEWVKGDISIKEEKNFLKVQIGKKKYRIKVAKEGKIDTAIAEEDNVYKEKDESKKW